MRIGESIILFALALSCASSTFTGHARLRVDSQYGWYYPGVYRIINYAAPEYAASLNDSSPEAAIVSKYLDPQSISLIPDEG